MRPAPVLILLSDASDLNTELNVLGLGLVQRTVMAARRAGYDPIVLGRDASDWSALAAALRFPTAFLVIAPATILAETDWLETLAAMQIGSARWATMPHRIVVVA